MSRIGEGQLGHLFV